MRIRRCTSLARNWGIEQIVAWTPTHAGKVLYREAGTKGGFQAHVKEENHFIISGRLKLEWIAEGAVQSQIVTHGEGWTVPPMTFHRETAIEPSVIVEVSDPTFDDRYPLVPDPGGLAPMSDEAAAMKLSAYATQLIARARACEDLALKIRTEGIASMVPAHDPATVTA